MDAIRYEWDEEKARTNLHDHGVSFETAILVFADPSHLSEQDRIEGGEHRWQAIGLVNGFTMLLVAHTWTDDADGEVVRIVSARRATAKERKRYDRQDH